MQLSDYLWWVIKRRLVQFLQHCTLHGAYYLACGRWWLRALWLLIVCCSMALCCFLGHMIWDKFVIDPTLTVVETTHYSTAEIPFPAVSMCVTELVHGPNTHNITDLLILRGYKKSQIADFYDSFTDIKNKDYAPPTHVRKMHYLLDDLGFPWRKLLEMFRKPCDQIVVECQWRSRPHNCTEMFRHVYTALGYCCQFDTTYFKRHATSATNFIAGVQTTEALDVIVSDAKVAPDGNVTDGFVRMYVFDLKDGVTLIDSAIHLASGMYFDVNVYLWAIDSSNNVKALDLNARKCILDTDPGNGTSFYQGCLTKLILKNVVNICKCIPFEYTGKKEGDVREIIAANECYQRCDYVQYETEVELIQNHRKFTNSSDMLSRVSLHFSETTCMKYRREVLYTWDQMLANLGGIFGLCLGGSVVSIMEIIWFLIDLLCTVIHETCTRNKIKPQIKDEHKNKIYVIHQHSPKEAIKLFKKNSKESNKKKLKKSAGEHNFKFIN